ncbi:MAG: ABC transporter ATP-binding protein [Chloroflexota bacterium]|nr:ABC transporter ATP-binding protein [Chloroflexota bacterium]MDE2931879.1 ABC transporter ATP-binding protein [Chloroflexota bacterium]
MSTEPNTTPRSWQRLKYVPPTLGLLLAADARGTVLHFTISIVMGLFPLAEVHALRRLIETAELIVAGSAPVADGLAWGLGLALLAILHAAVVHVREIVDRRHQEVLGNYLEERCLQQAQSMPLEWFEHDKHYDLLHLVRRRTVGRLGATTSFLTRSLSDIVTMASLLIYLGQFHWGLPLLLALGSTPGALLREFINRQRYLMDRTQAPDERRFGVYIDLLTGRHSAAEIRLFSLGQWLLNQAGQLRRSLHKERLQLAAREARLTVVSDGMNGLTHIAALGLSVGLLINGHISIGAAAALFAAIETFQITFFGLIWCGSMLYNSLRYLEDYFVLMDNPRLDLRAGRKLDQPLATPIVLENLTFTYPGAERPALSDLNLELRPGERIALVGENGAGKTTLVKLLMGLYRPTSGRILVDGVDLADIAPADWHRKFGTVFQTYLRYQTTVEENITFGWLEGADDKEHLQAVLTRSGAQEVVAELPQGLSTRLGKEYHAGAELSVGQWQKLAIARAYFRPAEILILDEPASALDAKAEAAVYRHFADLAQDRTAILISHRLASCQIADRILVLREGRLVEEGTHDALLASGGEYAELYGLQAAAYREDAS